MALSGGDRSFSSKSLLTVSCLIMVVLAPKLVQGVGCPEFPKQLSVNCAPHSSLDQCKFDVDCTESKDHMCCLIGCQKICLDPALIHLSIGGSVVCPVLPRPSPCPDQPNECSGESECSAGQKCCSDGCRMVCADPVAKPTTQPPSTDPWESCNTSVDLAFIIDSSGSIARRNYVKVKDFVKYIARGFGISPSESRAGIVLYSNDASIKAQFDQYTNTEDFVKAVDDLPHERGRTYIDRALRLAASQLFPNARKNVPKIAVLMTDGKQTDPSGKVNLREASAPLRKQGVRVLAFGVGKNVNVRELRLTVERDEDITSVSNFDDLINKVRTYTANLCAAAETEPIYPDADIVFLMDSSSGVSSQQFEMEKRFVRSMARYFIVSPLGPRAALVSYSATAYTVIGFSGYSSNVDFSLQINNARYMGGRRKIDQAFIHTASLFRGTGRVGLRIVILLTAGNYYTGPGSRPMSSVMSLMNSLDAHVYVIAIGPHFTKFLFTPMVRGPGDMFRIPSFNDLASWQSRVARHLRLSANAFTYERGYWSADVIFLMDSSKHVTANNYVFEKNFVKLMARLLNLASNRSRAALFTFSDNAQLVINFDGYDGRAAFDAAVNTAPHQQGDRFIDKAFDSATELLRTDSRATVPKYVILLTTGKPTIRSDSRSLANASSSVWSSGGKVFVVAVLTGGYTISEFYPAVQRPEDAFTVSSFVELLPEAPTIAARMMASWRAPVNKTFSADIAFIVDSSSSVSPFQYTRAKQFVGILSEYLDVEPGHSRGAFVAFGEAPVVEFSFDSYKLLSEYKTKVNEAPYLGGEHVISSALSAAGILFSNARGSHPWVAILVTSWRPDEIHYTRRLEILARPLLSRGVWLYVLSIGENPYVGWLTPMLVEPRDAFSIVSYRDLPGNIGPVARYVINDNFLFGHASFQVDILFLMDTSIGVNSQDYEIEKRFVQRIAMHLGVFKGRSRAALVAYGGNSLVVFGFGGYHSNADFELRLNEALMFGGVRRVDRALDTAAALMLGARPTMPKAVVLITAGEQSREANAMSITNSARPLRDLGAWLYVIAVGRTDQSELQKAIIRSTDIIFPMSFSSLYEYISPVAKYIANTSVITGVSQLNADIVFIVDCSSDVPYRGYSTQKAFVRSLTQYLNIQPDRSRAALIVYGGEAVIAVRLEKSLTFASALIKAPFLGKRRRFDGALSAASTVFENARKNVPKILMLFMAGKQAQVTGATSLKDAIEPLQQEGVTTFIFRIGFEPDIKELVPVVDSPENIFTFARFAGMDARLPYVARQIPFNSAVGGAMPPVERW